jgi:filamentous hemagglutinin family protein
MQISPLRFWLFSGSILFWLLTSKLSVAEIIPDNTLPVNSTVTPSANIRVIQGGTRRGNNIFHSFKEFSFSVLTADTTGDTAFFNNDFRVRNIITRITGGLISNIDGIIQANGTANLFFINPNGIVFGQNASLNIGGSFLASTANSLKFADGTEFSATVPQSSALLTINVPIGLQFNSNPGEIVNKSQGNPLGNSPVGLQVQTGKTLALVGGNIFLQGGNLTAPSGRIELGSVASDGLVNLNEIETGYSLEYSGVKNFGDIQLSQVAIVDTSGESGGAIQLQGRNITLTDASQVFSSTSQKGTGGTVAINATESVKLSGGASIATFADGEGRGGDVLVKAPNSVELVGTSTDGQFFSNIFSQVSEGATGNGGNLTIETRRLLVADGANVATLSLGVGRAGDVLVRTSDSVELAGTNPDNRFPSILGSQTCTPSIDCESVTGNGGNFTIVTKRLLIRDGARIDASTFGAGQAGDVLIKASNAVDLIGTSPNGQNTSGIFTQVAQGAIANVGDAGNLTIETKRLTALGGGQISSATFAGGQGGSVTINASDSIKLSGVSTAATRNERRSGIFVSAERGASGDAGDLNITTRNLSVENGGEISANNFGPGQGGTATLNVRKLVVRDGGEIRARSFAAGSGGNLTVNAAESVDVLGSGTIDSETFPSALSTSASASGNAGNLTIITPKLNVQNGAEVTVSATGSGAAGNLNVTANDLRLNRGRLTAETNAGKGANISLQNLNLLLMRNQSLISARAFNNANGGNININAAKGFIVAVPRQNNDIIANAFQGQGGKINITTTGIFGFGVRKAIPENTTNDIDASSEFGLAGTVTINTPDVDPSRGLIQLPANLVDRSQQIASGCTPGKRLANSSFVTTGRGGIPSNPIEPLSGDNAIANWIVLNPEMENRASSSNLANVFFKNPNSHTIVEAQGWIVDANGDIILVAEAPIVNLLRPWLLSNSCHVP